MQSHSQVWNHCPFPSNPIGTDGRAAWLPFCHARNAGRSALAPKTPMRDEFLTLAKRRRLLAAVFDTWIAHARLWHGPHGRQRRAAWVKGSLSGGVGDEARADPAGGLRMYVRRLFGRRAGAWLELPGKATQRVGCGPWRRPGQLPSRNAHLAVCSAACCLSQDKVADQCNVQDCCRTSPFGACLVLRGLGASGRCG